MKSCLNLSWVAFLCLSFSSTSQAIEWREGSANSRYDSLLVRADSVDLRESTTFPLGRKVHEAWLHKDMMRCGLVEASGLFGSYKFCEMDILLSDIEQFNYPKSAEVDGKFEEIKYTLREKALIEKNNKLNSQTDLSFSGKSAQKFFEKLILISEIDPLYKETSVGNPTALTSVVTASIPELRCVANRAVENGEEVFSNHRCRAIGLKASDAKGLPERSLK